jgi:hypothetical protein
MKKSGTLHDYFYRKAYGLSTSPKGLLALKAAAAVFSVFYSREKATRSAEEVFAELGYRPDVYQNAMKNPIRVYEHNLKGLLAFMSYHEATMVSMAFSSNTPASAIIPIKYQQNANHAKSQFVILESTEAGSYRNDMSDLSTLPLRCLEQARGDARLFKAWTLAHEITHFDIDIPNSREPERFVEIESYCDMMPMLAFQKIVDPAVFDVTFQERVLARAVAPVLTALTKNIHHASEPDDSIFGHATALMMHYPELLEEENSGKIVIAANKRAVERLAACIDHDSLEPLFMRAYRAANDILRHDPPSGDYSDHVIALFAEAIEYFSPSYAAQALVNRQTLNPVPLADIS